MKKFCKDENGTVLLEGVLCITATLIVIVMFMGLGFLCYQHAMMGIVANQVAEEIAITSKLKNVSDASSVTHSDVVGVRNYRAIVMSDFVNASKTKAKNIAQTRLTATSFAKDNGGFNVTVDRVSDKMGRAHYKIVVTNKYVTLFGDSLSMLGFGDSTPYTATSYVSEVDALLYTDYCSTTYSLCRIGQKQSGFGKTLENLIKFFHSVVSW